MLEYWAILQKRGDNMKKILFVDYNAKTFNYLTADKALDIMMTKSQPYEVSDNIAYLNNHRVIEYYYDLQEFNSRMTGLKESGYYDITKMLND